jgi:hypothetical protein
MPSELFGWALVVESKYMPSSTVVTVSSMDRVGRTEALVAKKKFTPGARVETK